MDPPEPRHRARAVPPDDRLAEDAERRRARRPGPRPIPHVRPAAAPGPRWPDAQGVRSHLRRPARSPRARALAGEGIAYSPGTLLEYKSKIDNHILTDAELCALRMGAVTWADLEAYFSRLLGKLGPCRAFQETWTILRMIFRAYSISAQAPDPFAGHKKPKYAARERGALDEDELLAAFRGFAFRNPLERAVLSLAFWAGLRRGEVWALRWEDIDRRAGRITVQRAVKAWGTKVTAEGGTKGRRSRVVPLPKAVADALDALEKAHGRHAQVIAWKDGTRPGAAYWKRLMDRFLAATGVDYRAYNITPHSARHTYASILHEEGATANDIREILGHGDVRVTDGYLHVARSKIDRLTERIGKDGRS